MIIGKLDFLERARLDRETLEVWIEEEWLLPTRTANELVFSEMDLARAKLIQDLKHDMGVNDEGVGVILNSSRPDSWPAKGHGGFVAVRARGIRRGPGSRRQVSSRRHFGVSSSALATRALRGED